MVSILLGNEGNIKRVYSPEVMQQLGKEAGLNSKIIIASDRIAEHQTLTKQADYLFSTWGMPTLSEKEIEEYFPWLKAVFYAAGSVKGFATPFLKRGIRIFSAWGANAVPVAEYTVAQILLANKGFFQAAAYNSRGEIAKAHKFNSEFPGNYRCKIGIIGAGMVGKLVIKLLKAYELGIIVFDPFLSDECARQLGVSKCPLCQIFTECQTISNHLANNPQTVGMLNYELFSLMQSNATFINTGRGAQIVEDDLVRILSERPNITALLDVTDPEPPIDAHPFYVLPNVFLTPHIAGSMGNEVVRMSHFMLDEFRLLQSDGQVKYEVTLDMLETMA